MSADGWILTNNHVVRGPDNELVDEVVVAVVLDSDHPPAEMFRAKVIAGTTEPDLALLKIESGLYGQAIPRGYQFPRWSWGDSSQLGLGDGLIVVGFSSVGGSGSRPIFTLTRGYMAGRELTPSGSTLMTDALITGGSSGGALTAGAGMLMAVPSFTVEDAAGQMAFALSLDQVPQEWKDLIGVN